jgi:hypothetical protein
MIAEEQAESAGMVAGIVAGSVTSAELGSRLIPVAFAG